MKLKLTTSSIVIILAMGLNSFGGAHGEAAINKEEAHYIEQVYQVSEKDMLKISFKKGNSQVSEKEKEKISEFVRDTKSQFKVEQYIVAAWSDINYPAIGELSKAQQDLAEERAENVKIAMQTLGSEAIGTFEMTKQPNWLQRIFSTETADIKGKGLNITNNDWLLKKIGKQLRDNGGPRTVVVIAKFENEVASHEMYRHRLDL